jgi:hypothetical protein
MEIDYNWIKQHNIKETERIDHNYHWSKHTQNIGFR